MIDPAVAGLVVLAAGVATAAGWVDWPALGQWLWPRTGLVVMFGIGGVLLAAAVIRAVRRAPRRRRWEAPRALSWWVIAAGGVVVVVVAWGATAWLLNEADQAKDPAAARVEAIKTGLGIGAGTGGVFALLLAVRRQWHQELSAAATEHDAGERRVTELYTKAAEQIGSDKAAVRLAGLYALERLAQDNNGQRQTVVNVLCAYLRMPCALPGEPPADDADDKMCAAYRERVQEREVRLAAQRLLITHLRCSDRAKPPLIFWPEIDLDLSGATIVDPFDLTDCHVRIGIFTRAHFTDAVSFKKATFVDASFREATFSNLTWFSEVRFAENVSFDRASFTLDTSFAFAHFLKSVGFRHATFADVSFMRATFADVVYFDEAHFTDDASFREAKFAGYASFRDAQFTGPVPPEVATFQSSQRNPIASDKGQEQGSS